MFKEGAVTIRGFADDACLLIGGDNEETMVGYLQRAINRAEKWARKNGLNFSPTKTIAVFFCRKRTYDPPDHLHLTISGREIEWSETVKYLGITLDSKLKWFDHIDRKIESSRKLLFLLVKGLGKTWGPSPALTRWMFTGIVRPALTYGCLVWGQALTTQRHRKKLRRLQALIMRIMCPKRDHTPIAAMEIIFHLPPLHLYIAAERTKAFVRNRALLPHTWSGIPEKPKYTARGHQLLAERQLRSYGFHGGEEWDHTNNLYSFEPPFTVQEESFQDGKPRTLKDTVVCYTDGSKYQDNVGAGFSLRITGYKGKERPYKERAITLRSSNTVYQAEVTAINEAVKEAIKYVGIHPLHRIAVFSDSRSALQALSGIKSRSKVLNDCKNTLLQAARITDVDLYWIKAHANHEGNERADTLAKLGAEAAEGKSTGNIKHMVINTIPPPLSFLYGKVQKGMEEEWEESWMQDRDPLTGRHRYRQSKHFYKSARQE